MDQDFYPQYFDKRFEWIFGDGNKYQGYIENTKKLGKWVEQY